MHKMACQVLLQEEHNLFLRSFYDSMQCFQFNKKHSEFLGTWNFGLQQQFKCFRIFNNVNQHNVPSRKAIKNIVPKVSYGQLGTNKMW
jgi:hypothetical protein